MPEILDESTQLESTTIGVYRTASTVAGGRRFSFGALVVVGNRNGQVGYGYAKSPEVPSAIEKAQRYARRNMTSLTRIGTTVHHEVEGKFSATKVRIIPASPGTGVVAGGTVRSILEMAGVSDALTKCYGSTNARNVVKAVFDALTQLRTPDKVASLRGVQLGETEIAVKIEKGKANMPAVRSGEKKAKGPVNTIGQDRRGGRGGPRGGGRGGPRGRRDAGPESGAPGPAEGAGGGDAAPASQA
jgi:small subunit ribosomal protein S5